MHWIRVFFYLLWDLDLLLGSVLVFLHKYSRFAGQHWKKEAIVNFVLFLFLFSTWIFFHEHSWFTEQQVKGQALYHFHPLHGHLDHKQGDYIANSRNRTEHFWFPSTSNHETTRTVWLRVDTIMWLWHHQ